MMLMEKIPDDFCLEECHEQPQHFDVCICYRRDTDLQKAKFLVDSLREYKVFSEPVPGQGASEIQIVNAACNSSVIILIISEHTFSGMQPLQDAAVTSSDGQRELAKLLRQMEIVLEKVEHYSKSVRVLPVYLGEETIDSETYDVLLKEVTRLKCWPNAALSDKT
jgi:hypothetical protein